MFAIIGLGNPGKRYAQTRHNIGFWVLDALAHKLGVTEGDWQEKFAGRVAKLRIADSDAVLVAPQTYMNRSGECCRAVTQFYKIKPQQCVVIHDDLDLAPGVLRIRQGGRAGGHNGVSDIIDALGTQDFFRLRIGIGHPRDKITGEDVGEDVVSSWVLGKPASDEQILLNNAVERGVDAVEVLLSEGLEECQRKYHQKPSTETV